MNSIEILLIILMILFSIVSFLSYLIAIIYDSLQLFLDLFITLLGGIFAINEPRPLKLINKLILEKIPANPLKQGKLSDCDWKLVELPKIDVHILLKWSKENRESCEKRIIPTTIMITLLGAVSTTQFFKTGFTFLLTNIESFLKSKSISSFDPKTITPIIISILLFYVVIIFIYSLVRLIRNIIAQNLVIEACVVAEYTLDNQSNNEKHLRPRNWFEKCLNCFGFFRNEKWQ